MSDPFPAVVVGQAVGSSVAMGEPAYAMPVATQPVVATQSIVTPPADPTVLQRRGYPPGLVRALNDAIQAFPLRLWIVDNSGSMNHADGSRLVSNAGKMVQQV